MIKICFIAANGEEKHEAIGEEGQSLLALAQLHDQPLEGTCEGQMACSTCHVIINATDFSRLPEAQEEEEDMLDLAAGATRTSRLACQIMLTGALDGLTVHMPAESRNMQGR